ncbi:Uncharacterised protein [Burkholderia pseudomallei]|uniref:hypothetical protein n=1 Tax=Burkholderia pseudomallei TaxID=28450 RepID=UPI000F1DEBE5|nr:hypothetical protein [Burkholderia pseudomallei]CAJ9528221.1 Uncharacterised protein [Burkholderia pseudomallei]VBR39589.1 Uncharacterised protein [Burkholderia pseudomallei]
MSSIEKHVRTNLTIATSSKFKDAVFQLAISKNMSISEFVRHSLGDMYPRLKKFDEYSEYAVKRNPCLRNIHGKKEERRRATSRDEDLILF